jgi:hypothetical protein
MDLSSLQPLKKNQKIYEFILVDTNSVMLTHNKCKWDPTRDAFSKCIIKKVISPGQWETFPWEIKKISQNFQP